MTRDEAKKEALRLSKQVWEDHIYGEIGQWDLEDFGELIVDIIYNALGEPKDEVHPKQQTFQFEKDEK